MAARFDRKLPAISNFQTASKGKNIIFVAFVAFCKMKISFFLTQPLCFYMFTP